MKFQIINNAKWIVACKVVQSLIQLIIGMISARYLGPSNYGLINYAAALVGFFMPVMQLGLQSTLVQEYVDAPEREGEVLGTALVMNLVSAVACIFGVVSFAAAANWGEIETIIVCALYSITLLSQSFEMLQYWFQAKLLSKYSSLAMLCAYVCVSAYKIYLLVTYKSVFWFALSHAVEYGVLGALLVFAYRKHGSQKIRFSLELARKMLAKSKHYILAALMVVVFQHTATIILKAIVGAEETGIYNAAVTCNSVVLFVFIAIIDTSRPVILESRKYSIENYKKNISRVYSLLTWMSFAQSFFFVLFAELVVKILYGASYMQAISVLKVLCFNMAFSCMGSVRNIWILAEEKHSILFPINLCGAVASIVLNLLLIPRWGAVGAAFASVLTQIFTNFILGFIIPSIRPNNRLLLKGLNPKLVLEMLYMFREMKQEKKSMQA